VRQNFNGTEGSFIITATSKLDGKNTGGGSSSQRSQSKEGTGSSDERAI